MIACCIGHRKINKSERLENVLRSTLISLIERGTNTFLFGSRSDFDALCLEIVSDLKATSFPSIQRVYLRAEYPYIGDNYIDYLMKFYDETFFPNAVERAGRNAYIARNKVMIDNSDVCLFLYDDTIGADNVGKEFLGKAYGGNVQSGTRIAYLYALSAGKEIININSKL